MGGGGESEGRGWEVGVESGTGMGVEGGVAGVSESGSGSWGVGDWEWRAEQGALCAHLWRAALLQPDVDFVTPAESSYLTTQKSWSNFYILQSSNSKRTG